MGSLEDIVDTSSAYAAGVSLTAGEIIRSKHLLINSILGIQKSIAHVCT